MICVELPTGDEGYMVDGYVFFISSFGADWNVVSIELAGRSFALAMTQTAIFANSHSDTKSKGRNSGAVRIHSSSRAREIYQTYDDASLLSTSVNPLDFEDGATFAARRTSRIAFARISPTLTVFLILGDISHRDCAILSVSHEILIVEPHHSGNPQIPIAT